MSTKSISPAHALSQFADDPAIIATAVAQEVTTVTTEAELPESLKYLKGFLPGLLFAHHSPDGEIVPQFRPDNPKDGPKYIFPRNSGSVLSINPLMTTDRPTVAIIEGTKQMIFATTYAPDDVLVVGIQGCWGWSSNGQGLAALDDVVQGKDVIVIFDADVSSNPDVYNAGESLTETLSVIGAKSVKFAPIPGSRSVGLDDFLANRAVANRGSAFSEILAKAVPFNKVKKPAKRKVSVDSKDATFSYVSVLLGEICTVEFEKIDDDGSVPREQEARPIAGVVDERNVRRVDTLLHAAVTVESVIVNDNDLTPGVEASYSFDLKVQFGPEDDCREQVIYDVPDNDLGNVRRWLARAGIEGLQTELGSNGLGLMGGLRIAEAIRADMKTREFKQRVSRPNSGWYEYDGEPMWSDVDGSHTTSRKRTDVVAKLEGSLASLSIPGFNENFDMKILFDALDKFFDVENYLVDSTPWIASVSALFWALAGGDPDAVLYILGGEGSGKSSIMGLVSSFLSPQWGTAMNPMASADGSSAYLRDLVKQPHNMLLVVDDVRGRSSSRAQDTQADGLEALIRPAYGGGGAFAPKQVRNANGDWVQEKPKYNRFFLCIVGEVLPEAERQSSIERCLVIEVDKATSLRPAGDTPSGISGHEHFTELSRDHALVPISSAFLVAACQWIAYEGGLEKWKASLSSERTRITSEAVATRVADTSPRVRDVAGTFLAGASTFLEWVQGTGYFTEEQLIATETKWHDQLITATQRHSVVNLYSGGEADVVISKVVDAVASGRFAIGPAVANQTTVGVPTTVKIDGESVECIALLPGIVGQIAGPNNLPGRLDKLLVRDSAGRRTRSVRIDGTMTARCFVIKRSDWNDPE